MLSICIQIKNSLSSERWIYGICHFNARSRMHGNVWLLFPLAWLPKVVWVVVHRWRLYGDHLYDWKLHRDAQRQANEFTFPRFCFIKPQWGYTGTYGVIWHGDCASVHLLWLCSILALQNDERFNFTAQRRLFASRDARSWLLSGRIVINVDETGTVFYDRGRKFECENILFFCLLLPSPANPLH